MDPSILDKIAEQYPPAVEAGITSFAKLPGVIRGTLNGIARAIDWDRFVLDKKLPWVFGKLSNLPIDAKGGYSAFVNPSTAEMAYTPGLHLHEPLAKAVQKATGIDPLHSLEGNFGRIRRLAHEVPGAERGTTHIWPPYISENIPLPRRLANEASAFDQISKLLQSKGLTPAGEDVITHPYWGAK